ncbi:MAG: flagellar hook-basal body complex protein FliE [Defluviitaleaceae bacterium]|nr:flagellar hook-basal body complex protein FliE [Defluviitaleaceae bacterium]
MNIPAVTTFQPNLEIIGNMQSLTGSAMVNETREPLAFQNLLDSYMDMVNEAGRSVSRAEHLQIEFALGNHDDMLSVVLAQEMAYVSMHFAVQVTSRIIDAYREIMRMQI